MPRRPPPKGYIRSKEVQEILNISSAMVRIYVQKGKIKHLVPKGNVQGFYLESDVKRLAKELQTYLHVDETKERIRLARATEKDIPACLAITRALFASNGEDIPTTPPDRIHSWIAKNPQVVYVLTREDEHKQREKDIIGYVFALPFKPDTSKIPDILRVDFLGEVEVLANDIETYAPGNEVVIYIAALGIRPDLPEKKKKFYGSLLIGGFIDEIIALGKEGVVLKEVLAVGATRQGVRLLQTFGFSEIRPLKLGKRTFSLKVEESGAQVAEQYRKALQEWKEQTSSPVF